MATKKANQGVVTSIADTDLVMVCSPTGKLQPVAFANLMSAIRGKTEGGRNLLLQKPISSAASASIAGGAITLIANSDFYFYLPYANKSLLSVGKTYTLSFSVRGLPADASWAMRGESSSGQFDIALKNGHNSVTFILKSAQFATNNFMFDDGARSFPSGFSPVTLFNFQLEEGSVATGFNPAPEEWGGNWFIANYLQFDRERRCA